MIENIKDADGLYKAVVDLRTRNGKPMSGLVGVSNQQVSRNKGNSSTAAQGSSNG